MSRIPYLVYASLSLAVLGSLLSSGYILNLDMVFSPNVDPATAVYGLEEWGRIIAPATAPFDILFQSITNLIPVWLVQKVILWLILFLGGVGAHKLLPFKGVGSYFAGVLYMINPFTYTRFLAGQWGVLLAYALTPFAIKAFIDLLDGGGSRKAIKVAVLSTLVGMLQIHGFFLLFLALAIILVLKVTQRQEPARMGQTGKYVAISAVAFLALNLYWLVPMLTATGTVLEQVGRQDLLFFAPKPTSNLGVVFDTASMYGFWRGGYIFAKDLLPLWWLLFAFILYLAVYGFVGMYRHGELGWQVKSMAALGVISFILALGAASTITRPIFEWLWQHLFFFRGFRDSQKFVALLCLAYAYLGGLGVSEFAKELRQQTKKLAKTGIIFLVSVALLTPPVYSFTMFSFHNQLGTTDYPKGWYEVNDYLNRDEADFNVLFLPWHQYMDYSWLPNRDKRLGNPADSFFDKPVIQGDNIEVPGIYTQSPNPISRYIEFLLARRGNISNLGELLAPVNVKYVILVHESDYHFYDFLYRQQDLTIELEKPGITLFQNQHATARSYAVDSLVYIQSLDDYLQLSQTQDVMKHVYIFGSGQNKGGSAGMEVLESIKKSPAKYQVGGTSRQYTVFTVPQNVSTGHWQYNGTKPIMRNLGFMPVFESTGGGDIIYTRFYRVYLPAYIISLAALILVVGIFYTGVKWRQISREKSS